MRIWLRIVQTCLHAFIHGVAGGLSGTVGSAIVYHDRFDDTGRQDIIVKNMLAGAIGGLVIGIPMAFLKSTGDLCFKDPLNENAWTPKKAFFWSVAMFFSLLPAGAIGHAIINSFMDTSLSGDGAFLSTLMGSLMLMGSTFILGCLCVIPFFLLLPYCCPQTEQAPKPTIPVRSPSVVSSSFARSEVSFFSSHSNEDTFSHSNVLNHTNNMMMTMMSMESCNNNTMC